MKAPFLALTGLLLVVAPAVATAEPVLADDSFKVRLDGPLAIDLGLAFGTPAALGTGMSTGVGAGVAHLAGGGLFAWGVRASWSTATEFTTAFIETQSDLRVRATGAIQHSAGRGTLALRLGAGPTIVHETRTRAQGMRAGLTGTALETSAYDTLPAADLEGVIALHIAGPWVAIVSFGPSIDVLDGSAHWGWTSELGVAWQP